MDWTYLKLISKHLHLSLPTLKGHLRQEQYNIISTKTIAKKYKLEVESSPTQDSKTQDCFFKTHNKGSLNNILRPYWKISNYFKSRQPVHCHLLQL